MAFVLKPRHWAILLLLSLLWGSSYLMIRIALEAWSPDQITGLRILLAAVVLLVLALVPVGRYMMPRSLRPWAFFLAIALIGNCIPFYLISWGQQQVESGLAGILAAVTPLCVLLMAHFMLDDERITRLHLVGFLLGFAGVVVLMGPDSLAAIGGSTGRLVSQLAILAGAVCYALATVLARLMPGSHPVVTSAAVMVLAALVVSPLTVPDAMLNVEYTSIQVAAIAFLGVLCTGVASIMYFYLVSHTSARFVSLLNYLVPLWAVTLGWLVFDESLTANTLLALMLVISALVVTQLAMKR